MGYILPVHLYNQYWKRENTLLKLYAIERTKRLSRQKHFMFCKSPKKKVHPSNHVNDIKVSSEQYFKLTGKGNHINEYI